MSSSRTSRDEAGPPPRPSSGGRPAPTTGGATPPTWSQNRWTGGARPGLLRLALAVLTGAAWALAAEPRGWWPLLPVGACTLAVALRGQGLRARVLLGAATGVVTYTTTLWWLIDFSAPGYVMVTLVQTALLAAALALVPTARTGRRSVGWWALPAALVLLEAVQTRFPLGGFPLPALALTQVDGPFAAAAPLGGSLLVTATAATTGVALASLLVRPGLRRAGGRWWPLVAAGPAVLALLAVLVVLVTATALPSRTVGWLDAAVVQGGGPRGIRAVLTDPADVTERQLAVVRQITGTPELVVLPENVVTVPGSISGSLPDAQLAAAARRLETSVVAGVVESEATTFRNLAVLWGPEGRRLDHYEKEHRVPFGEYIPARALIERLTDATELVPRDAGVGQGDAVLDSPAGPLAVAVSYEVFFADRVREGVRNGGRLVVVPTNAASYTTEEVPAVELAAARLRAREFDRSVLQAAPTGYSAVVLPDGHVAARSDLGTPALLRASVPLRTALTPYARTGDVPMVLLALIIVAAGALTRSSTTRHARRAGEHPAA